MLCLLSRLEALHASALCKLHSGPAPDTTASQAGQKRRKSASTPATGANTIPLPLAKRQPTADLDTTTQPISLDMQPAAQQSSSSANAQHDVSLIDDLVEAYAADPYFVDEGKTAYLTFAQGL